eukprot:CAMPEP_0183353160 /NCGR_PEP_ID=MMETSP0164_2-20130417/33095_1 /TAXON_ID=221442 /ORGANISM="Coccolithus pelagicus ssp braarudi, Strain PLY182g" /LENGTH=447 /DNA_ID=CAMNT_0025525795 /DNA_START=161 /DNA_END=1504 /DNA_ORIENTATION=+
MTAEEMQIRTLPDPTVAGSASVWSSETRGTRAGSIGLPSLDTSIPSDERITAIFTELDVSGDGFIDLEELQAALTKVRGTPISMLRAREILEQVDENGDEQISLEEFKQVFRPDAPDSLRSLARTLGSLELFIDEVRMEVLGTQFNGPILFTAATATFMGVFWKYILAFSALIQYRLDADTSPLLLPESLELVQTIPASFLADYSQAVELAPLLTMACTSCFAYAVGDFVAQRFEGRGRVELLDLGRSARNALLGFGLHGPLVYAWIQVLEGPFATLVGGSENAAQWSTLLLKIVLDQTFFAALINIIYATLNGLLSDLPLAEAFARARQVLVPAMVSSWRFWPAVQLISYSPLVPVDFKLLWIDSMEIFWVAYLSATVNSAPGEPGESFPWGEGRYVEPSTKAVVFDEPGDSDLLSVGPIALFASFTVLTALAWPALLVQVIGGYY